MSQSSTEQELQITVSSWAEFKQDALDAAAAFDAATDDNSDVTSEPDVHSFHSVAALFNTFTPKRLELLATIIDTPEQSITALARSVDRPVSEVSRDAAFLTNHDLISIQETGREKHVTSEYTSLTITIEVPADIPGHDRKDW